MKECQNISEKMLKYIDAALNKEECKIVEDHIEGCRACQNDLESLKNISHQMKSAPFPSQVCPDSDLLVKFSENDVTFNESREIKSHLEDCVHCREEVTLLLELKQELSLEESVEIYEKKVMPASLMSQVKEIYNPPPRPVKIKNELNIFNAISYFFSKKKIITALATCSVALFMAVNGAYHLAPNYLTGERDSVMSTAPVPGSGYAELAPSEAIEDRDYNTATEKKQLQKQVFPSVAETGKENGIPPVPFKEDMEVQSLSMDEIEGEEVFAIERPAEEEVVHQISHNNMEDKVKEKDFAKGSLTSPEHLEQSISQMCGISQSKVTLNNERAMVKLSIEPGYNITSTQLSSIITLVSEGAGLPAEEVDIYDSRGLVLSDNILPVQNSIYQNSTPDQRLKQHNFEEVLTYNLQSQLDEKFGPGNAIAQVSSAVEFTVDEPLKIPGREEYAYSDTVPYDEAEEGPVSPLSSVPEENDWSGNSYDVALEGGSSDVIKTESEVHMTSGEDGGNADYVGNEKVGSNVKRQDIAITVEPPGTVEQLNVSVILNNQDYDENELKELVAKGAGMDYEVDQLNIINTKFMKDPSIVVQAFKPDKVVVEKKSFYNSPLLGIISIALAGILLFFGIKSLF